MQGWRGMPGVVQLAARVTSVSSTPDLSARVVAVEVEVEVDADAGPAADPGRTPRTSSRFSRRVNGGMTKACARQSKIFLALEQ